MENTQVYLLCRWGRHSAGFLYLGVVDGWQFLSELVIALVSLSRDRKISMQLNTYLCIGLFTTNNLILGA